MLSSAIAGAPAGAAAATTAVVVAAVASEASVAAVATLLVAALVSKSSKAVLAVLAALQMRRVPAVALLLGRQTLAGGAGSALGGGSGAALLGTERRGTGSALGVAEGLQRVVRPDLLAHLLLTERRTLASVALSAAEGIRETAETASGSTVLVLRSSGNRPAILAKSSTESVIATMLSKSAGISRGRAMLVVRSLGVHSVVRLGVHALSAESAVATAVATELVHVLVEVRSIVVRVLAVAGVVGGVSRLSMRLVHMLALRTRSARMLTSQSRVGGVVAAVLALVIAALGLIHFVRSRNEYTLNA